MDKYSVFDAAYDDDIESLEMRLEEGAPADYVHPVAGHTLLQAACEANSLKAIKVLLYWGADPNKRFTKVSMVDGRVICKDSVALMHVTSSDAAKILIDSGANFRVADNDGRTAIDWARQDKNQDLILYLDSLL